MVSRAVGGRKGQITIPSDIRRVACLEEGDLVEVELTADGILLRPLKAIDAAQAWFWDSAWQTGEREAEADARAGRSHVFVAADEFLASLDR